MFKQQLAALESRGFVCGVGLASLLAVALFPLPVVANPIYGWVHQTAAQGAEGHLSAPSLNRGYLAYSDTGQDQAVYRRSADGTVLRVADTISMNQGPGSWRPGDASVDELGDVSFAATLETSTGAQTSGVFGWTGGQLQTLALSGETAIRGSTELVGGVGTPVRSFGTTTFSGQSLGSSGLAPELFATDTSQTEAVIRAGAVTPTTLPPLPNSGYTGHFDGFGIYAPVDWNERRTTWGPDMAFLGYSTFSNGQHEVFSEGIFIYTGFHTVDVIAERYMAMPDAATGETFKLLQFSPSISDGRVAFTADGDKGTKGVYLGEAGKTPVRIADTLMDGPAGFGKFTGFGGWVSVVGQSVMFSATNAAGEEALFVSQDGVLSMVFGQRDFDALFPDEEMFSGQFGRYGIGVDSFSGNQVGFRISSFNPIMDAFYDRIMVATAVMPEPHAAGLVLMALAMAALARRQRR
jgi:hypothetical protein